MDVALLFAIGYGLFMGSYPVPVKSKAVLDAQVHPLIFQAFKSSWVFATGFLALIPVALGHRSFQFSWWGVASAAAWVPSGLCTIFGVTEIGLSMTIVVSCATNAVLSFLVFWLVFDQEIKQHEIDGHQVYLAPAYLAAVVVGMFGLVFAPQIAGQPRAAKPAQPAAVQAGASDISRELLASPLDEPPAKSAACRSVLRGAVGLCAACGSGAFGAAQYGMVTAGKRYEQARHGCLGRPKDCPPAVQEAFDSFGSWLVSFGIGAALVTLVFLAALSAGRRLAGRPPPPLHWRVMRVPGSTAGICWSLGNFCGTAAAARGADEIIMAQMSAIQLVTSGLWGLLYYREIRGRAMAVWGAFAVWTIGAIVLLGMEKGG